MIREFSTKLGEQFINTFVIVYMQCSRILSRGLTHAHNANHARITRSLAAVDEAIPTFVNNFLLFTWILRRHSLEKQKLHILWALVCTCMRTNYVFYSHM